MLDAIVHPENKNAPKLLDALGLADVPTRERVHREIEQRLLLPQEKLPEDWLPRYQEYVYSIMGEDPTVALSVGTGNRSYLSLLCYRWRRRRHPQSFPSSEPA